MASQFKPPPGYEIRPHISKMLLNYLQSGAKFEIFQLQSNIPYKDVNSAIQAGRSISVELDKKHADETRFNVVVDEQKNVPLAGILRIIEKPVDEEVKPLELQEQKLLNPLEHFMVHLQTHTKSTSFSVSNDIFSPKCTSKVFKAKVKKEPKFFVGDSDDDDDSDETNADKSRYFDHSAFHAKPHDDEDNDINSNFSFAHVIKRASRKRHTSKQSFTQEPNFNQWQMPSHDGMSDHELNIAKVKMEPVEIDTPPLTPPESIKSEDSPKKQHRLKKKAKHKIKEEASHANGYDDSAHNNSPPLPSSECFLDKESKRKLKHELKEEVIGPNEDHTTYNLPFAYSSTLAKDPKKKKRKRHDTDDQNVALLDSTPSHFDCSEGGEPRKKKRKFKEEIKAEDPVSFDVNIPSYVNATSKKHKSKIKSELL